MKHNISQDGNTGLLCWTKFTTPITLMKYHVKLIAFIKYFETMIF